MVTWQNGNIGSRQAVDTVIDSVLQVEPMHPGAHHYRIHLWDGDKPTRAEKSAALYAKTAPGIAHAWHMPGHTYTGLKRYADAAYQQEGSARVDHAYMIRDRVMPFEIHNYAHNNQWLATSLSHIGRARDAIAVARNLVEQPRDPNKNGKNDGGSPQRSGRLRWSEVLVRYELWDDLIAATDSGALDWSDIPLETKEKAYTLGLAYAAKGDKAKLAEQIAAPQGHPGRTRRPEAATRRRPAARRAGGLSDLLAKGDVGAAFETVRQGDRDASRGAGPRPSARPELRVCRERREGGRRQAAQPGPAARRAGRGPARRRQDQGGAGGVPQARTAGPRGRPRHAGLPAARAGRRRLEGRQADWTAARAETRRPTTADRRRSTSTTLGPLAWSPFPAEPISRSPTREGRRWTLADHKGRNVVVLFFLGGKCAHCMQQLQVFGKEIEALKALNTDVVAVSTDDLEATRALKENADGIKFPMPMLPDPKLDVFKTLPRLRRLRGPAAARHLPDRRQGNVRFQRISAEPFLDVDFIKAETERVTAPAQGRGSTEPATER